MNLISAYIKYPLFVILIIFCNKVNAQSDYEKENEVGVCIGFFPNYIFISTFRIEVDKQLGDTPHWLVISNSYSNREDNVFWNYNFTNVEVYGASLSYRYYFFSSDKPKWLYSQAGAVYNHSRITFDEERWEKYNYNGNEVIRLVQKDGIDIVHQYGADFKIGIMLKTNRFFFFDLYAGLGIRGATIENVDLEDLNYDGGILGPAYTGILPIVGVRLGVNF